MWVIDASAAAELVLSTGRGERVAAMIGEEAICAPQHMAVEVASVVRGWTLSGKLGADRGRAALTDLLDLDVIWLDVAGLVLSAWDFRHNVSACDAVYVAAAQTLEARVLTCDARLAAAVPEWVVLGA